MTDQHPITPPPELVQQWVKLFEDGRGIQPLFYSIFQAGADQELEACCKAIDNVPGGWADSRHLRHVRRPNPPSLKDQALEQLREVNAMLQFQTTGGETSAIRRALEALDD
jgi:hypothetical protein